MKFKFICVIVAAIIALCSTSCVENVNANTESNNYVVTLEHWNVRYNMSIYKVTSPNGNSYTILCNGNKGGICVLD